MNLEMAEREIENARAKHPGCRIPFFRVFAAHALNGE